MIKLKEKIVINAHELAMLKAFQKKHFKDNEKPSLETIKVFLAFNEIYNKVNIQMLQHWVETRYKRDFLTDIQISEWFEFYYN